ncbi:HEAT repeat domain-containing protein [Candidatus Uabimicrobium amorphum]|nr:HEAT repeat domain-containing protein [Candidatus Uabimicrobium amorphum]
MGWKYLQYVVIFFILFCLAFAQSEDEKLNKQLELLVAQLQSSNIDHSLSALVELRKLGDKAKVIRPELLKILKKVNINNRSIIQCVVDIITQSSPQQVKSKKTPKTITTRSAASRISKNLGGLNILGTSSDFHQRLRYNKQYAVVIGINKYDNFTNLKGPNFDASEIARVLRDRYQFDHVNLLLDKPSPRQANFNGRATKVTKNIVEDAVQSLKKKVKPDDALFFFYAGHGVPGYLVVGDSEKKHSGRPIEKSMVSLKAIAKSLESCGARHTLMVLDCCFSGSLLEKEYRPDFSNLTDKAFVSPGGSNLTRVFNRRVFQVITAGAGDEAVADKLDEISTIYAKQFKDSRGHSPFTAVFLQAIQGLTGRDDGIILASQLGFYMMDTLVNDDRINASQAPRYGTLGGNGDFMFFPVDKVLNPKMVAPLYLNGVEFAAFRRSGCEALENFIAEKSEKDRISLIKSALPHVVKLITDEQKIPRMAAVKFIKNEAQKYASKIEVFSIVVPILAKTLTPKKRKVVFSLSNDDQYMMIECLGSLHSHIKDEGPIDILKRYYKQQESQWRDHTKDKEIPYLVKERMKELPVDVDINSKTPQVQGHYYHQRIQIYRWLHSTGKEKIELYESSKNKFLSLTENVSTRLQSFDLLKKELTNRDFIEYFATRDKTIRTTVLAFLAGQDRDLPILFQLLKEGGEDIKIDAAKDLEKIGKRAFFVIVDRLKLAKAKKLLSQKKYLWLPLINWQKESLFPLINHLTYQDKQFLIPLFAEVAFDKLYSLMLNGSKNKQIRSQAAFFIGKRKTIEPFIAKFFISLKKKNVFEKLTAIDSIISPEKKCSMLEVVVELLKSSDEIVRLSSVKILKEMGEKAHSAIPALIPLLQDSDSKVREHTSLALAKMGEKAIPFLIVLLKNAQQNARLSAFTALQEMGERAHPAVPALIPLLQDSDPKIRVNVSLILAKIGKNAHLAIPALISLLQDSNSKVRGNASLALVKIGKKAIPFLIEALKNLDGDSVATVLQETGEIAIPALIPLLQDSDPHVKKRAISVMSEMGEKAHEAVPTLIPLLQDADPKIRESVSRTLANIGKRAHAAIPALIPLLQDSDRYVKKEAIRALWRMGEKAHVAIPALIPLLQPGAFTADAAYVLGEIGEKASPAIPYLIPLLNYRANQLAVVKALGKIGGKAEKAIPYLIPLLKKNGRRNRTVEAALKNICKNPFLIPVSQDPSTKVMKYTFVGRSRKRIDTEDILILLSLLHNQDNEIRLSAAKFLIETRATELREKMGKESHMAVPALIPLLQDPQMKYPAIQILGKIRGKAAIVHLIPLLQSKDIYVRGCVVQALGEMGEIAQKTVPLIIPFLQDDDPRMRQTAATTLGKIGEKAHSAIPALISLLEDSNSKVKKAAIIALGNIGERAHSAVPFLKNLLQDRDYKVQGDVVEALGNIGERALSCIPSLMKLSNSHLLRWKAKQSLDKIRQKTQKFVPSLTFLLQNSNPEVRRYAISVINDIGEKAVPSLISILQEKNYNGRLSAVEALGKISKKADQVIPLLMPFLQDSAPIMRMTAAAALGEIGEKVHETIPSLISLLKDSDLEVKSAAVEALGKIGAKAEEAIPFLAVLLQDESSDLRRLATEALGKIGEKSERIVFCLIPLLEDENSKVRDVAIEALVNIGLTTQKSIFSLIPFLHDRDAQVKITAAVALSMAKEKVKNVVPHIIPLLEDQSLQVKVETANILGDFGQKSYLAIPQLILLLGSGVTGVEVQAISALGKIGEKSHLAIPYLMEFLEDGLNPEIRRVSAKALGRIGKKSQKAIPVLISRLKKEARGDGELYAYKEILEALVQLEEKSIPYLIPLLKDPSSSTRIRAAEALGKIGEKAEKAIPDLIPLLKDQNKYVRIYATEALGGIGKKVEKAIPDLIPLLKDEVPMVTINAMEALGKIGGKAEKAIPYIIPLLKDNVYENAPETLGKIGERAIPHLIPLLKDPSSNTRSRAAQALGKIGEKAEKAIPHLIPLLKDTSSSILSRALGKIDRPRSRAAQALGQIGEKAEKAIPHLIPLLKDKYSEVRESTAEALGQIGEKAIPHLIPLLENQHPEIRKGVTKALSKIGKKALHAIRKSNHVILNSYLWESYLHGYKNAFTQRDIELLSQSKDKTHLETVAITHAWKGNEKEALKYAKNCSKNAKIRINLLLKGISQNQVELVIKNNFKFLNDRLWENYVKEQSGGITKQDIIILEEAYETHQLDTLAAIYAWKGNIQKANKYADKAQGEAFKRVKLLLKGKPPKQVEEEMKKGQN